MGKADLLLFVTSKRCIPVKIHWYEVQSCFVLVRYYSYCLLCSVWLEQCIILTSGLL